MDTPPHSRQPDQTLSPAPPAPPATNVVSAAARIGEVLVHSLPPAFLGLVALNMLFLASLMWFLDRRQENATTTVNRIVESCLMERRLDHN